MPKIPEETVNQVLDAIDPVAIMMTYLPDLKRKGADWWACCPFHHEKTASFSVSPAKRLYFCHGCKKGGNIIGFVRDHEGLSFFDATKKLADQVGVRVEQETDDPEAAMERRQRGRLMELHKQAASWYQALLLKHEIGQPGRDYLKSRGFGAEVAKGWHIGYAPPGSDMFLQWARSKGFSDSLLIEGGLLSMSDDRRTYARFRERVMFPIYNDPGDIIAFSGRILDPNSKAAKYMNSPETPLFNKSKVFFGLQKTKRSIMKESKVIIYEGQLDLIASFENGIENGVAPLGTAFTADHARILKRHCGEAVLCFDSDTAGYKAAERAFAALTQADLHVRAANLPPGEDPDSLIGKQGADAFREIISNATDFIDFQMTRLSQELDLSNPREKVDFAEAMADSISCFEDKILQDSAINAVATRIGTSPEEIRRIAVDSNKKRRYERRRQERFDANAKAREDVPAPLEISNRSLKALCRSGASNAEARSWLRSQNLSDELPEGGGYTLLKKLVTATYDPEDQTAFGTYLSSLPPEEEAALTALMHGGPDLSLADTQAAYLNLRCEEIDREVAAKKHGMRLVKGNELLRILEEVCCLERLKKELEKEKGSLIT